MIIFLLIFLAFEIFRFCVIIRFFHPLPNGQWPPTSKDFYPRLYPLHFNPIFILQNFRLLNLCYIIDWINSKALVELLVGVQLAIDITFYPDVLQSVSTEAVYKIVQNNKIESLRACCSNFQSFPYIYNRNQNAK